MKAVGIKVLKDNLSKYLKLVRSGEIVWVTDRDEVIAEIHSPTVPIPQKLSAWDAFLNDEVRRGAITKARTEVSPPLSELAKENSEHQIDLQTLLDELRDDRDLL